MTAVARDEVEHLAVVSRLLARRGGRLTKQHSNPYAAALRGLVRMGTGRGELVDRLLISGLIEARSCERFRLLADACEREDREGEAPPEPRSAAFDGIAQQPLNAARAEPRPPSAPVLTPAAPDRELAKLYRGLWASEHGHYLSFHQLAE